MPNWKVIHDLHAILEAARYAAEKHSSQKRKGATAEPYINHLLEVAQLVAGAISEPDTNLVIAALLHDAIEDAQVRKEDLAQRFGSDVAELVQELTDDKTLGKEIRKQLQIENAPTKSPRAQVIKIADKISNMRSLLASPPVGWEYERKIEYFHWAKKVVDGLRTPNPVLLAEFERTYQRLEEIRD